MNFEFSRFGLQHIMAISGFHFAIIAAILSLGLSLFLPKKKAALFLIFLLSSYFVFLGSSPSIMRAWITILITLAGLLLQKRGNGLNSLGIAMMLILIIDPLQCRNIGFQFSFLATAAILLLYQGCEHFLRTIFPKRNLNQMIRMHVLDQHGYFLLNIIRQALALTLAVNLTTLPLIFYYFQKFAVLSLIYNLFFPFLVSISMLLLVLGIIASFTFPPLGIFIHSINNLYTRFVLNFTYNIPTKLDVVWRVNDFSLLILTLHLCLVFCFGIWIRHLLEKKHEEMQDLAFL